MLMPSIILERHKKKGVGLFATHLIKMGTIIWLPCKDCSCYSNKELNDYNEVSLVALEELGYRTCNGDILMPCSNACYMNHSCIANVLDFGLDFGIAVRNIKAGEEICCDYRTWNNEEWKMICMCDADGCIGVVSPKLFYDKHLQTYWADKIRKALKKLKYLKQPLHNKLLENSIIYKRLILNQFDYLVEKNISVKCLCKSGFPTHLCRNALI